MSGSSATYAIEFVDPESGEKRQFQHESTTWREAKKVVDELRTEFGVEFVRMGVVQDDGNVRELFTTGSVER